MRIPFPFMAGYGFEDILFLKKKMKPVQFDVLVFIGARSIIAAESALTKDIPANVIAGGNPCKVIRSFHD